MHYQVRRLQSSASCPHVGRCPCAHVRIDGTTAFAGLKFFWAQSCLLLESSLKLRKSHKSGLQRSHSNVHTERLQPASPAHYRHSDRPTSRLKGHYPRQADACNWTTRQCTTARQALWTHSQASIQVRKATQQDSIMRAFVATGQGTTALTRTKKRSVSI